VATEIGFYGCIQMVDPDYLFLIMAPRITNINDTYDFYHIGQNMTMLDLLSMRNTTLQFSSLADMALFIKSTLPPAYIIDTQRLTVQTCLPQQVLAATTKAYHVLQVP
jgi:hypothetical protein